SPLHLVLKAMDHLPRNFENVLTNLSTCLVLPLSSMVTNPHPHPPYRASWRDLKVHHLYKIDQDLDTLVPIDPSRPLPRSITLKRILQRILAQTLVSHPVLFRACLPTFILESRHLDMPPRGSSPIDLSPFLSALSPGRPWSRLSTRSYRMTCSQHRTNARPIDPTLRPQQLRSFWSFALPHRARNVWFHGLHHKLSCRALLHCLIPSTVASPLCTICQQSAETQAHFLFDCPQKSAVWIGIWLEFFGCFPSPSTLSTAFHSFVFPLTLDTTIPAASVFGLAVLAIWDHHWAFHFQSVPFQPSSVLRTACKSISRLCSELSLDPQDSSP
ncbi:hypothetical protein CLU79DRAFT_703995, partial [Phycomyces nitens]